MSFWQKSDTFQPIQWPGGTFSELAFKSKNSQQRVSKCYKLKLKEKIFNCIYCFKFTSFHFQVVFSFCTLWSLSLPSVSFLFLREYQLLKLCSEIKSATRWHWPMLPSCSTFITSLFESIYFGWFLCATLNISCRAYRFFHFSKIKV